MQEIMNLWKVCHTSSTRMNLTPHDVDGRHRNRECEIETEKYCEVLQLSLGPSQDAAECSENSKNSKDSKCRPHRKQRECFTEEEWSCRIERSIASAR